MASIRAKIDWKRPKKSENKKLSLHFVPPQSVIENSTKVATKFKKLKNNIMASFQANIGR